MNRNDEAKDAITAAIGGEMSGLRSEEPTAPPVPELPPSAINTDVRRHGINPVLTGVMIGIIVSIIGFLLAFAYLVVSYFRYADG